MKRRRCKRLGELDAELARLLNISSSFTSKFLAKFKAAAVSFSFLQKKPWVVNDAPQNCLSSRQGVAGF
jgi:hypothetical protein